MIENLKFTNYKRIRGAGVQMTNLARVNYLVGENNSGKSSVLQYIFEQNWNEALYITDSLSEIDVITKVNLADFDAAKQAGDQWRQVYLDLLDNKRIATLDLLAYASVLIGKEGDWNIIDKEVLHDTFEVLQSTNAMEQSIEWHDNTIYNVDSEIIVGGENKLINLIYSMLWANRHKGATIFVIDNPANHLHPTWQKKLPSIFEYVTKSIEAQIFTATHSPFVISAVAKLEDEGDDSEVPIHKVYFLKDGQVAGRHGSVSHKGSDGYEGAKIIQIASQMLGAGLSDLYSPQSVVESGKAPILILCEGEGVDGDARLYNLIFKGRDPAVMFASSRGSTQLIKSFSILNEIKPALSVDFGLRMVRDRDHDFADDAQIQQFEQQNPGARILKRRAIECYLYNSETAELILGMFHKKLLAHDRELFDGLHAKIQHEAQVGIKGDGYKRELEAMFEHVTRGCLVDLMRLSTISIPEKIAELINPDTEVYKELEGIILK